MSFKQTIFDLTIPMEGIMRTSDHLHRKNMFLELLLFSRLNSEISLILLNFSTYSFIAEVIIMQRKNHAEFMSTATFSGYE